MSFFKNSQPFTELTPYESHRFLAFLLEIEHQENGYPEEELLLSSSASPLSVDRGFQETTFYPVPVSMSEHHFPISNGLPPGPPPGYSQSIPPHFAPAGANLGLMSGAPMVRGPMPMHPPRSFTALETMAMVASQQYNEMHYYHRTPWHPIPQFYGGDSQRGSPRMLGGSGDC